MRKSLKKSKLMTSIVEKVEGNDDLLMEILLLLPPKSIFKFKCVSKRWSAIIDHPLFHKSYRDRTTKKQLSGAGGRLLAFVQPRYWYKGYRHKASSPRPSQNILPIVQQKIKPLPDSFGTVIHSSEGLFLCRDHVRQVYCVVNPLTRKWVQLPPRSTCDYIYGIGLACKENIEELVPSFKVLGLVGNLDMDTFSYDTGRWTRSTLVATEDVKMVSLKLVCRGVFHWETQKNMIAVYNSNRDENCVVLIKVPKRWGLYDHLTATRSSTDNLLWIATGLGRSDLRSQFNCWKLPIDDYDSYKCATTIREDQWVLMHTINGNSLFNELSLVSESKKKKIKQAADGLNDDIKLEAMIPSNPVAAILNLQQNIFLYNMESQSLELVKYRGRPYGETRIQGWLPYIESLSLSTYGPLVSTYE